VARSNGKAGRILAGLFGLFLSLSLLAKSLQALALALQLRAALPNNPGLHLEVKEAFFTFMFTLIGALALGWWGVSKFWQPKPAPPAA
jgi:hypothetical protein